MTGKPQLMPVEESPTAGLVSPMRLLGRQPIVYADGRLFGYELLSRSGSPDAFSGDPEQATREVVDHWLMLVPEANEVQAFVNCTRDAFVEETCTLLPAQNTVLEILETIEPDPELISSLRALRGQGYRFALDDFVPLRSRDSLMEFADFIKIDFLASDAEVRKEIYAMAAGTNARLLAEKIETKEEMLIAQGEGCSLFQGYFFSRPHIVSSRSLPQNHVAWLRLLTALNRKPTDLGEIEKLILADAALCYRILRLANSALHCHVRAVTSVRDALMMVGEDAVRRMVTVAMAGVIAGDRAPTVVNMALVRARFCELLAPELGESNAQLYLLGMLSLLDVLLEIPMQRILTALPIDPAMKDALLGRPGPLSRALDLAKCLEACEWPHCEDLRKALSLEESAVAAHYVEALRWTSQALQA